MPGKVLWQVEPDGQTLLITEDLQPGLVSKATAEEGVDITHVPITEGQSQEQGEELEEALADDCDEAGQNTLAPPSNTVMDITSGVAPQGESSDFVMLTLICRVPLLGSPITNASM